MVADITKGTSHQASFWPICTFTRQRICEHPKVSWASSCTSSEQKSRLNDINGKEHFFNCWGEPDFLSCSGMEQLFFLLENRPASLLARKSSTTTLTDPFHPCSIFPAKCSFRRRCGARPGSQLPKMLNNWNRSHFYDQVARDLIDTESIHWCGRFLGIGHAIEFVLAARTNGRAVRMKE